MDTVFHVPQTPKIEALDARILNDSDFKEDSVREEILAPLLRHLGYSTFGQFQVKRSRPLVHPYVSIGSKKRKVNIFPDYLLMSGDQILVALDAKDPSEDITCPDHLSQAYTYAVHREVKAPFYGLCNGHQIAIHRTSDMSHTPYVEYDLLQIADYWHEIFAALNPVSLAKSICMKIKKDFGLHLQAMGFTDKNKTIFMDVPFLHIGKHGAKEYTIGAGPKNEEMEYCCSFDFEEAVLNKALQTFPKALSLQLKNILIDAQPPTMINLQSENEPLTINIEAHLGSKTIENKNEIYRPLIATKVWY